MKATRALKDFKMKHTLVERLAIQLARLISWVMSCQTEDNSESRQMLKMEWRRVVPLEYPCECPKRTKG